MRAIHKRPDELCPEEARATAGLKSKWGCPPVRVLDRHGDHLGWRVGGYSDMVVYDREPFQLVTIIRPERLLELPEYEEALG